MVSVAKESREMINKKLRAEITSLKKHICSSCDLDDIEEARIRGYNEAMDVILALLEDKKGAK